MGGSPAAGRGGGAGGAEAEAPLGLTPGAGVGECAIDGWA